jgi:hypothetical protein
VIAAADGSLPLVWVADAKPNWVRIALGVIFSEPGRVTPRAPSEEVRKTL